MSDEEETMEIDTGHNDLAVNQVQQRIMNHMLGSAQLAMGFVASDLKCDLPKASSITLSALTTVVMVFIRGYPREVWAMQLREVGEYFLRQAQEAEAKEGEANDSPVTN